MHIEFSKGYLYLDHLNSNAANDPEFISSLNALHESEAGKFGKGKVKLSYGLNKNTKIDLERLKQKANKIRKDNESSATGTEDTKNKSSNDKTDDKDNEYRISVKPDTIQGITISDSEFFDQTLVGRTMLTNTNQFESENHLKETLQQESTSIK